MRLNIDFERMKEIYGDEIEEIINENIDIIEKNIRFLNDLNLKMQKEYLKCFGVSKDSVASHKKFEEKY